MRDLGSAACLCDTTDTISWFGPAVGQSTIHYTHTARSRVVIDLKWSDRARPGAFRRSRSGSGTLLEGIVAEKTPRTKARC